MKLKLTLSPQKLGQEVFVCLLLKPQTIVTQREILPAQAAFWSDQLGLPVILIGQGIGDFWQSFGEQRFAVRLNQIGLALLVWRTVDIDLNG